LCFNDVDKGVVLEVVWWGGGGGGGGGGALSGVKPSHLNLRL